MTSAMTYTQVATLPAASIRTKPTGLVDPTSVDAPAEPAFPLTQNNLQDLMEYTPASGGRLSVVSKVDLPAGAHFCDVFTQMHVPASTRSSIQTSKTAHEEFNSALVYMNHSRAPTLELEVFAPGASGRYPTAFRASFASSRTARSRSATS
ncbi:hypothetical protein LEL_10517 [Akanthomyces lecanii RCEF 1005]|uniref:Uncharacterized protein n=1 Tax=Akanthomyces lecanii RCEF 1005 TaxID=1081108 RepID=A0A167YKN7_CORDF|nr:hypothetical protein LEL_10517 [Akanthomyces lecanii RCEF 1005]